MTLNVRQARRSGMARERKPGDVAAGEKCNPQADVAGAARGDHRRLMIRPTLTIVTGARALPPLDPGCDLHGDVGPVTSEDRSGAAVDRNAVEDHTDVSLRPGGRGRRRVTRRRS
jgi:hypothetical protein